MKGTQAVSVCRVDDIAIRPFNARGDSDALRKIVAEAFGGGIGSLMKKEFGSIGGRSWGEWLGDDILAYFEPEGARSFVAIKDHQIVGFCSYRVDHARKCGQVGYNAVSRNHQGRGIGSAMMQFVMDQFQQEGMIFATVLVADNVEHAPAQRIYEKFGFQRFTGYHEMAQRLPSPTRADSV